MIVTFKSKATGNLIYFKDIALKLLALMGRDDKVPSALYAEEVGAALEKLQQALSELQAESVAKAKADASKEHDIPEDKVIISIQVRAQPLLEMLQKAAKKRKRQVHFQAISVVLQRQAVILLLGKITAEVSQTNAKLWNQACT